MLTTKELDQIDEWVMSKKATISQMTESLPEYNPDQMIYVPKKESALKRIKTTLKKLL